MSYINITSTNIKKNKYNYIFLINYIIFLKKFKKVYLYNNQIATNNPRSIIFLKKSNLFFKSNILNSNFLKNKLISNNTKVSRVKGKKKLYESNLLNAKNTNFKAEPKLNIKFYKIKESFLKKLKNNTNFLKKMYLKKNIKKKNLMNFFYKLVKQRNSKQSTHPLNTTIYYNLLVSQFFYHNKDILFFLKKGLVFINGAVINNA